MSQKLWKSPGGMPRIGSFSMWFKEYRDYKIDDPLKKETTSPGRGMIGCEMHDLNGWGETYHVVTKTKKRGMFRTLLNSFFAWFGPANQDKA